MSFHLANNSKRRVCATCLFYEPPKHPEGIKSGTCIVQTVNHQIDTKTPGYVLVGADHVCKKWKEDKELEQNPTEHEPDKTPAKDYLFSCPEKLFPERFDDRDWFEKHRDFQS